MKRLRCQADSRTRDIPVVAVSANAMIRDIEPVLAAGFAAYLAKPLDLRRFMQLVEKYVASTRT